MPRRGPRFSWQFALLALTLAITFALLLAEVAVRAAFPSWAPRTARMTTFWRYDPVYGWSHLPGASGRFASVGFDVAVRINAKGFRGREIPYARNGTARRILILGDSHVWGFGVEEEETFGRVLERKLPDAEVVNLGVSGYSTDQELLLYEKDGVHYSADVIMLVVSHNDLRGNTRTIESAVYGKPRFLLEGDELVLDNHPVPAPSRLRRAVFDLSGKSYLLTRVLRVLDDFRRTADVTARAASTPTAATLSSETEGRKGNRRPPFPWAPTEKVMARLIRELQRTVARKQPAAQLLVVFADFRNTLGREATEYLGQFGIPSVALDAYVDPRDPALHLADGLHWTPAGHVRVADVLAQRLNSLLHDAALDATGRAAASAP
jgi:lysophospholipase L1-like esterase